MAGSLVAAGFALPDPTGLIWLCFGLAVVTIIGGCGVSRDSAQLLVNLIGFAIPSGDGIPLFSERRKKFREVLDDMNGVLADSKLEPLAEEALVRIVEQPPRDAELDIRACVTARLA